MPRMRLRNPRQARIPHRIKAKVEYKIDAPLAAEQLADLFGRSGIRRPVDDLVRIAAMIRHANLIITAW